MNDDNALPYEHWEAVSGAGEFEEALIALREVVALLEAGQLRLNDSVRCFELGTLLARRCERLLEEAELRVSQLDANEAADASEKADTDD